MPFTLLFPRSAWWDRPHKISHQSTCRIYPPNRVADAISAPSGPANAARVRKQVCTCGNMFIMSIYVGMFIWFAYEYDIGWCTKVYE